VSMEQTIDEEVLKSSWKEECAVFGVWGDPEASRVGYLGLFAQQHRGQESAGLVSLDQDGHHVIDKGMGLVGDVFKEDNLKRLKGRAVNGPAVQWTHCHCSQRKLSQFERT